MTLLPSQPRLLIGAEWCAAPTAFEVRSPYDDTFVASVPLGDAAMLDRAVGAAHVAYRETRRLPAHARSAVLTRAAGMIDQRRELLAAIIVAEAGKPLVLAEAEVQRAVDTFTVAAEEARRMPSGEVLAVDAYAAGEGHLGLVRRFPVGVVYGVTPYNFPLNLVAHKIAPALASGNTIVIKPSPRTPLSALALAAIVREAGALPGQVNVVTCPTEVVASPLGDARVQVFSFTGSAAVGWTLRARATVRKVVLELGGNAAVIVHDDADVEAAVPLIANGAFANAGQSCISVQRLLVHSAVYDAFRAKLLAFAQTRIRTGDPSRREVLVGPMIDNAALQRALAWVRAAEQAGGRVLCGGAAEGRCLPPTLLENVPAAQPLWAEEVFAPVAVLQRYERFEEALGVVNASRYGLQAGVFTRDSARSYRAFRDLDVGAVLINQVPSFRVEHMPYGGVKDSGLGREGVRYAMDEMTEPRALLMKLE